MKKIFTLLFASVCAFASAQNVVSVQMKDGTVHNYSLDEFSKISFTDSLLILRRCTATRTMPVCSS